MVTRKKWNGTAMTIETTVDIGGLMWQESAVGVKRDLEEKDSRTLLNRQNSDFKNFPMRSGKKGWPYCFESTEFEF